MDYGRDDESPWTVRKPGRDRGQGGPLAWLYAHVFILVGGICLGGAVGYIYPLIIYARTSRHGLERALHEDARDELTHGTNDDARRRATIGAVLGGVAALGVAFASARKQR